ncbi:MULTISPECIES: PIG-L deacetylase family protein [unclassified Isoptericola]|uniref:PIG-L deacetylase family protein n=1 Tax=unclassified Isoptericola TaxID=2623355 RepID=UPI003663E02F
MTAAGAVRRAARGVITRTARDVTAAVAARDAVVLAPHPDDETLGVGATILRKVAAGARVTVVVVTDGRHSHASPVLPPAELARRRSLEMAEAARRLGLGADAVRRVGLEDGTVAAHEDALVDALAALLDELRPAELYTTAAGEPHPDHAAVGRAARRAAHQAALGAARSSAPGPEVLEYPVWLWGAWPLTAGRRAGSVLDAARTVVGRRAVAVRTGAHRDAKRFALDAHASQLRRPAEVPDDAPWAVLPPDVLAAALGDREVFFRAPSPGAARPAGAAPAVVRR